MVGDIGHPNESHSSLLRRIEVEEYGTVVTSDDSAKSCAMSRVRIRQLKYLA